MLRSDLFEHKKETILDNWIPKVIRGGDDRFFTISNYTIDSQKFAVISLVPGGAGGEIFLEIHDPKFFLMSDKDLTIPKIRRKLYVAAGHEYWFNVAAEYLHLLDRPAQRCEDNPDYSFTQCLEVRLCLSQGFRCISTP